MHQKLFSALDRFVILSSKHQEELSKLVKRQELPKNAVLQELGETSNYLHFVEEGTVRAIYYQDSKEITAWFGFAGDFVSSFYSFVSRKPSPEKIVTISDCKLISISYETLQFLYEKDIIWNKLGRLITERYYMECQERILSLQSMSAAERYDNVLDRRPDILKKVKLGHLASYLGMAQANLSRLRSTWQNRQRINN
ncbi:Crp/Fnr family transcriptional regulator [Pseudanabaena sp. PCC 6802]|uniref:Crp/Fnr family transcriptional regulator n=1 Tax=Pseudanabaena sp. PCC 6802 TaxID=118173 RepID=UPI0003449754|nr:Crp/Fnr family transcriptional regulator [Pseudanabaena sp. PCC 6802]